MILALVGLLAWAPAARGAGQDDPPAEPDGAGTGIELRAARKPSAEERARMVRWHVRWQRQAAPLERLLGRLGAREPATPVGDREWCRSLAGALLAFDRESAFPVPAYAADVQLRRAIRRLVLGATACLQGRLHEAVYRIRRADESFADAALVLRPYGVAP